MSKEFLYTLLDSMSVSGHEIPLQKKVIAEMTPHCDKIITDYTGNVVCVLNPDAPFKVMLAAHIDEIGLIVTHIQPDGLLRVSKSGGIFPGVYPGHQVAVHGYAQTVYGAVVRSKDMDKADLKADELYIDIGAKDDATSLDNLLKALDMIDECNKLRADHGLEPLKVSETAMAMAMVQPENSSRKKILTSRAMPTRMQ